MDGGLSLSFRARDVVAQVVRGFMVIVHTHVNPTQDDWLEMIRLYESTGRRLLPSLVYTEGGAPNARQRAELAKVFANQNPRVAVLTPSLIARTVGQAVRWFNPELRVFRPDEIERALDHIEAKAEDAAHLREVLKELKELLLAASDESKKAGEG